MTTRLRGHAPALLLAAAGVWAMTYTSLYGFGWNDYLSEALPSVNALTGGHIWQFLVHAPVYGGSLELRAPFALLASLAGGHEVAVYRAMSIPCLIAAGLLGVWLVGEMPARGHGLLAHGTALGLCVANPITFSALQFGHAEELLGAVLCIAAVLTARRGHPVWAGLLLGLAIANKQWALLAIGPVLLALPDRRRLAIAIAGGIATCFYVPLLLPALTGHGHAAVLAGAGSAVQPWQLWWFLGTHIRPTPMTFGLAGMRVPPAWVGAICHPLIVALGIPATLVAARRSGRDPMLLLAFLLALRCALDTWDTLYYPLPFLLALLVWEVSARRRPPLLSLLASVVVWALYVELPWHVSVDGLAALFALVAVPTLVALGLALYRPGILASRLPRRRLPRRDAQPSRAPADAAGVTTG